MLSSRTRLAFVFTLSILLYVISIARRIAEANPTISLYSLATAPYVVKAAREYNYGILDISPSTFTLMVYNDKGLPLDTVQLTKGK